MTAGTYTAQAAPGEATSRSARRRALRGDIEGLRAVAVLMVLVYHVGFDVLPGGFAGVDVFLVISGFLITSQLLAELDRTGRISLVAFYARRARRLLPAATVVLVFTALAGLFVVPAAQLANLGRDVAAAALYVVNWALAWRSVDYLAEDAAVSPLQHYWSLSVEEQYYLVWPLLILLGVLVARRFGLPARRLVLCLLVAALVTSLAWSIVHTARSPETAYFVTTTRIWELAVGASLAYVAPTLARLPRPAPQVLAALGVVAIAVCGVVVSSSTPWPGSAALLPVLGTGAVIAAGCANPDTLTGRLLGVAPMRWLGGLSYSIYLWHWPLLVFAGILWPELGLWGLSLVGLTSVLLSWLTGRYVEDPVRFGRTLARRHGLALGAGALGVALSVGSAGVVLAAVPERTTAPPTAQGGLALESTSPGPADPTDGPEDTTEREDTDDTEELEQVYTRTGQIWPEPALAPEDVPAYYADECQTAPDSPDIVEGCVYGDADSGTVVAVVGDSKMGQWMPALEAIAQAEGWRLELYLKSACAFTAAPLQLDGEEYTTCTEWNGNVLRRLSDAATAADLVLVSQGRSTPGSPAINQEAAPEMVQGLRSHWNTLEAAGSQVVVLADTPAPAVSSLPAGGSVYECVDENREDYWACSFPANDGYGTAALTAAAARTDRVDLIDLNGWICPDAQCRPVIGRNLVYRQGSHITATYARSLAPVLHAELVDRGLAAGPVLDLPS